MALSHHDDLKVNTSLSLPVEVLVKLKQLDEESATWEDPIYSVITPYEAGRPYLWLEIHCVKQRT